LEQIQMTNRAIFDIDIRLPPELSEQCFLTPFRGGGKLFLDNVLNSRAFLSKNKEEFDRTEAEIVSKVL
jgi:hypothetical protein